MAYHISALYDSLILLRFKIFLEASIAREIPKANTAIAGQAGDLEVK